MKKSLWALAALACLATLGISFDAARAQSSDLKPWISGWYNGEALQYYDFGANSTLVSRDEVLSVPVWMFIYGKDETGAPEAVPGQQNIIDARPGDLNYTDLWDVTFVTVPRDYEPNAVRSAQEIQDAGYPVERTGRLVNCPVVPATTISQGGERLNPGWEDGERVTYFDFGPNPNTIAPVWMLMYGFGDNGFPRLVPGQHNIFDSTPNDAQYTAFRRIHLVTVPEEYTADSIRSEDDIVASGYDVTETDTVLNLPVVRFTAEPGDEPAPAGNSYDGRFGGLGQSGLLLGVVGGVIALGVTASGVAFYFAQQRRQRRDRALHGRQRRILE
ncbi:MAG: hypothetical protein WEB04_07495 [Dehalococcoidia bacterium]